MNEHPQHEFDDELLSAYLDNELSNDERARVESHLASDPAAQRLLDQLRGVSQSIRDLPLHSASEGLSHSILSRIEAIQTREPESRGLQAPTLPSKPVPNSSPLTPGSSLLTHSSAPPRITIGRTRRAWFWASFAVAAALLIMFLQPGNENGSKTDVAMVAKTEPQSRVPFDDQDKLFAEANPPQASPQRSLSEPAAPPTEFKAPQQATTAPYAPSPPRDSSIQQPDSGGGQNEQFAVTSSAPPASPALAQPTAEPASSELSGTPTPIPPASNDLVVVHVAATRDAIQNNSFENLLRTTGVAFETVPRDFDFDASSGSKAQPRQFAKESPATANDGARMSVEQSSPAEASRATKESSAEASIAQELESESQQTEMILVDATRDTLESFLTSLNRDATNFTGIDVEAASAKAKASLSFDAEQKPALNFSKFNRGNVPGIPALAPAHDYYHYFSQPANTASPTNAPYGTIGGMNRDAGKPLPANPTTPQSIDRGRAVRLHTQSQTLEARTQQQPGVALQPAPSAATDSSANTATMVDSPLASQRTTIAPVDRIQVLFVIQPTDAAEPILKAKNPR